MADHQHATLPPVGVSIPGCSPQIGFRRYWAGYVTFKGTASRAEFWGGTILVNLLAGALGAILGTLTPFAGVDLATPVAGLYSLAAFLPGLAVAVRRLHDSGKSGWWMLPIMLVETVALVLAVLGVADGSDPLIVAGLVLLLADCVAYVTLMCLKPKAVER